MSREAYYFNKRCDFHVASVSPNLYILVKLYLKVKLFLPDFKITNEKHK